LVLLLSTRPEAARLHGFAAIPRLHFKHVRNPIFHSPLQADKTIPKGDDWLHEPKLHGYRLQIIKDGRQISLYSKGGYDWIMIGPSA